jgi:hypothetical protein
MISQIKLAEREIARLKAPRPSGTRLHEIKHDGLRVIARKDGNRVRLYNRPGDRAKWRRAAARAISRPQSDACLGSGQGYPWLALIPGLASALIFGFSYPWCGCPRTGGQRGLQRKKLPCRRGWFLPLPVS